MNKPKFRAWSEPTKEMKYNIAAIDFKRETIHFDNGVTSINSDQERDFWHKPYSLMQSTGLKDKNGVEIFEGDVVTGENFLFPFPDNRPLPIYWDEETGGFQLNAFNKKTIEILGNIYEDGDLLNDSEDTKRN